MVVTGVLDNWILMGEVLEVYGCLEEGNIRDLMAAYTQEVTALSIAEEIQQSYAQCPTSENSHVGSFSAAASIAAKLREK